MCHELGISKSDGLPEDRGEKLRKNRGQQETRGNRVTVFVGKQRATPQLRCHLNWVTAGGSSILASQLDGVHCAYRKGV